MAEVLNDESNNSHISRQLDHICNQLSQLQQSVNGLHLKVDRIQETVDIEGIPTDVVWNGGFRVMNGPDASTETDDESGDEWCLAGNRMMPISALKGEPVRAYSHVPRQPRHVSYHKGNEGFSFTNRSNATVPINANQSGAIKTKMDGKIIKDKNHNELKSSSMDIAGGSLYPEDDEEDDEEEEEKDEESRRTHQSRPIEAHSDASKQGGTVDDNSIDRNTVSEVKVAPEDCLGLQEKVIDGCGKSDSESDQASVDNVSLKEKKPSPMHETENKTVERIGLKRKLVDMLQDNRTALMSPDEEPAHSGFVSLPLNVSTNFGPATPSNTITKAVSPNFGEERGVPVSLDTDTQKARTEVVKMLKSQVTGHSDILIEGQRNEYTVKMVAAEDTAPDQMITLRTDGKRVTSRSITAEPLRNNQQRSSTGFKNMQSRQVDNRFDRAAHISSPVPSQQMCEMLGNSHIINKETGAPVYVSDEQLNVIIQDQQKLAKTCTVMKSPTGIDTIICLDTSGSMAGEPIKYAREAIRSFLDGLEYNAVEHELEENVAIVTIGSENKILQHLTNDFHALRKAIENVEASGVSNLWLGLALALTEISQRGESMEMTHSVLMPRIIIISDGYITGKNILAGNDITHIDNNAMTEVIKLVNNNARHVISNIDCVTVGPHNKTFLSAVSSGRMFKPEDIKYIAEFFRTQVSGNDLLSKCLGTSFSEEEIKEKLQDLGVEPRSMEDIRQLLASKIEYDLEGGNGFETLPTQTGQSPTLQTAPSPTTQTGQSPTLQTEQSPTSRTDQAVTPQTDGSLIQQTDGLTTQPGNSSLTQSAGTTLTDFINLQDRGTADGEDTVEVYKFGTHVRSHPKGKDNNLHMFDIGTIIGPVTNGMVKVIWSNGEQNNVRCGADGFFDITPMDISRWSNDVVRIGAVVTRGCDWCWEDQDGGKGSEGVVIKVDVAKKIIHVNWQSGSVGKYRNGYGNKFDVELCPDPSPKVEVSENYVVWHIQTREDQWEPLPLEVGQVLEERRKTNSQHSFLVKVKEQKISLASNQARNTVTQEVFPISRMELSHEEWLILTGQQA